MQLFATKNKSAESSAVTESREKGSSWFRGHRCVLILAAVMILGLILRFVFAYGISAADGYALSGGTTASSHLRIVLEILSGTYNPGSQIQLNYPYGIESASGPFYDYLMAGIAGIGTMFGVSDSVAVSGAMAWTSPIFGVLTAIPVFLLAKKVTDDETVSLVQAFVYTFTALAISVSPFSYGGEYALLGFLAAFMAYAVVCAVKAADEGRLSGLSAVKDRRVLYPALQAGALYGLVALTWSDFRVIVIVTAVILALNVVVSRVKGRDFGVAVGIASVFLGVGTVIAAIYYIPVGLWSTVFMGGCVLAAFTIVYGLLFVALGKKPWVVTVPCFLIAIIAVGVLLGVFAHDLAAQMFHNTNLFVDGLARELSESFSRSSISSMATWFGWLTVWMPLFVGAYMIWRYKKKSGTRMYDLTLFGLLSMFFICWFSTANAILAAPVMAICTAYVLVLVVRRVEMRSYFSSLKTLRGSGVKGGLKKVFNFFPFISLVVIIGLVVAPNAISAFDAATPSNDEKADYFGGMGYTINTSDSSLVGSAWNEYSDVSKDGALLTWYGYSDAAAVFGGFDLVTSPYGNAAPAMSVALMQGGSAGAIVSMTVRILEDKSEDAIKSSVSSVMSDEQAAEFVKILKDPAHAESTLKDTDYADLKLDDGLRVYYGAYNYLSKTLDLSEQEMAIVYDKACSVTGEKISYIQVDSTMLPLAYGDGDSFSTIAYLGGYEVNSTGGIDGYYMMNSSLGYSFYYAPMYNTFAYQALFGCPPSYYGLGNTLSFFGDLGLSDGEYKPLPGYGLAGFEVDYWHVMYNPDSDATGSSSGWVDMAADEAIQKQAKDGGVINYLRSVVVMKYVGVSDRVFSGTVKVDGTDEGISDVTVNVYAKVKNFDPSAKISRVLYSSCVTDADGNYSVVLPREGGAFVEYTGEYDIVYSTSAEILADGNVFLTETGSSTNRPAQNVTVSGSYLSGARLADTDGNTVGFDGTIKLVRADGDKTYEATISEGSFNLGSQADFILPGTYDATVYKLNGESLFTAKITVVPGEMKGITLSPTVYKLSVTVNDQYSNPIGGATVVVYDDKGRAVAEITAQTETDEDKGTTKGVATKYLLPGTYSCVTKGGYICDASSFTISSSNKSVTLSVLPAITLSAITIDGGITHVPVEITSPAYTVTVADNTILDGAVLPMAYDYLGDYVATAHVNGETYRAYGVVDVGGGQYTMTLYKEECCTVSGTVKNADGTAVEKATVVVNTTNDSKVYYTKAVTDENGKYSFSVPKGASVTIYAYDASNNVKYAAETIDGDKTVDMTLESGMQKSFTIYYYTGMSSSSKGLQYYSDATATVYMDGGASYQIKALMADASGRMYIPVPSGYLVSITLGPTETKCFYLGSENDTGDKIALTRTIQDASASEQMYLQYSEPSSVSETYGKSYFKQVTAAFDTETQAKIPAGKMTPYRTITDVPNYTITNGVINEGNPINPGQYKLEITSGSYYFDSTAYVYVYPSATGSTTVVFTTDIYEYYTVKVTGSQNDTYSIVTDGQNSYKDVNDNGREYYIEKKYEALIGATNSDGDAAYAYVSDSTEVDLSKKYKQVTISGTTNLTFASGTVTATDAEGKVFKTELSSGEYSITVPGAPDGAAAFQYTMELSDVTYKDDDGNTYTYMAVPGATVSVASADVTYNFGSYTTDKKPAETEYAEITGATMNGGIGEVTLRLTTDVDAGAFYLIDGSEGFILDRTYSIYVHNYQENLPNIITVQGTYNIHKYGAGSEDIAVNVKSADGTVLKTLVIPAKYFTLPTGPLTPIKVQVAGDDSEVYDSVNGYSYTYTISLENPNAFGVKVNVTGTLASVLGADRVWTMLVSFDGHEIAAYDGLSSYYYDVPGYGTVTASVTLVSSTDFGYDDIPKLNYKITAMDKDDNEIPVENGGSGTLEHKAGSVTESSSSVENADNSAKKISTAFYILLIIAVLLLLVFVYSANKRGVFSRR